MRSLVHLLLVSTLCSPAILAGQAPGGTEPPPNQRAVLTLEGIGSQVYRCQANARSVQWIFEAPVARLFDASQNEVGTHGDGPVWTYQDGSSIQGVLISQSPSPEPGSIPWLLLKAVQPQRTGILSAVSFISRSNTKGGVAPTSGCDVTHTGDLARVPYTATYTFFAATSAGS